MTNEELLKRIASLRHALQEIATNAFKVGKYDIEGSSYVIMQKAKDALAHDEVSAVHGTGASSVMEQL